MDPEEHRVYLGRAEQSDDGPFYKDYQEQGTIWMDRKKSARTILDDLHVGVKPETV